MGHRDGTFQSGTLTRFGPFGNYVDQPVTNPARTNHGFIGHRHNDTGENDLVLICINDRLSCRSGAIDTGVLRK